MKYYLTSILVLSSFCWSSLCFAAASPVTADFSADKTTVVVGETVTFTDNSNDAACFGDLNAWNWDFGAGATPPTANTQGPHAVTYSSVGTKTVQLTADGDVDCEPDTETKINYITVIAAAIPTLSEWSLILMALLLMNFGVVAIAQEKLSLATSRQYSIPFTQLSMPFSHTYFSKAVLFTAIFAFLGFAASVFLTGTIAASDLIGVFLTAPVFAYLVHLIWGLKDKEQSNK